jgi:hypothetical protein
MWEKIEEELQRQGKSIAWLSEQTGVVAQYFYNRRYDMQQGRKEKVMGFDKAVKIADALGVSLDVFRETK